jgi:hypothetical protein
LLRINLASSIAFARNFARNAKAVVNMALALSLSFLTLRNRERYKEFSGASLEAQSDPGHRPKFSKS